MALDTQSLFAVKPGMIVMVGTLAGMTTGAGQHLSCSRIKDVFTDRMSEHTVFSMAPTADFVYRGLYHGRMVGTMGSMAVIAGIRFLMAVFY